MTPNVRSAHRARSLPRRRTTATLARGVALAATCLAGPTGANSQAGERATSGSTPQAVVDPTAEGRGSPARARAAQPCAPAYGPYGRGTWPPACWRPYAANSPFNTPVPPDATPVTNSAAIVRRLTTVRTNDPNGGIPTLGYVNNLVVHDDGTAGEPTYYARDGDPTFPVVCADTEFPTRDALCPLQRKTLRVPAGAVRESGPFDDAGRDWHMTVVDQQTGVEYDLWRVEAPAPLPERPRAVDTLRIAFAGTRRIDGLGDGLSGAGDATAAHWGSLAGRVRAEEFAAGRIDHALFITVDCVDGSVPPVYPADTRGTAAGQPCTTIGLSNADAPPLGAHLQLNMTVSEIDDLHVRPWQRTLLVAMREYGMYVGDTGASGFFAIEQESGNQYQSVTRGTEAQKYAADAWRAFASANWNHHLAEPKPGYPHANWSGCLGGCDPEPSPAYPRDSLHDARWWATAVWGRLRVLAPPPVAVASVEMAPGAARLAVGESRPLTATVRDGAGRALGGRAVAWASSDARVVAVSGIGVVTAVGAGSATVTAVVDGVRGAAGVTVAVPTPPQIPEGCMRLRAQIDDARRRTAALDRERQDIVGDSHFNPRDPVTHARLLAIGRETGQLHCQIAADDAEAVRLGCWQHS